MTKYKREALAVNLFAALALCAMTLAIFTASAPVGRVFERAFSMVVNTGSQGAANTPRFDDERAAQNGGSAL